jgi:hypothetical protein
LLPWPPEPPPVPRTPSLLLLLLLAALPAWAGCGAEEEAPGAAPDDADLAPAAPASDPWAAAGPTGLRFDDVTAKAGITEPNHSGRPGVKEYLVEAPGPGAAWVDYDSDGFLDLYVPDGDVLANYEFVHEADPANPDVTRPVLRKKAEPGETHRDQLWRNKGDGTFENVAAAAGIEDTHWSFGATAFDYDADGRTDIYVCNYGPNRLWRNNGDGTFTDIAEKVGLRGDPHAWSTAAAVGDVDGDGRLDLYVGAYSDPAAEVERLRLKQKLPPDTSIDEVNARDCTWRGIPAYCGPVGLKGLHDTMYRQREDGTFEDVSVRWGLRPRIPLYTFTILMYDVDEDGLQDLYVANDSVENLLWMQTRSESGRILFREEADRLGVKYGRLITPQASMGMAAQDVDQDGRIDIFVTNFSHDYNNLFLARLAAGGGALYFKDYGLPTMGQQVHYDLSWGCGWYDFDNDGDRDLFVANGHVYKEIDLFEKTGAVYDQHNTLFECMDAPALAFREVGAKAQVHAGPETPLADLDAGSGMAVQACSRQAAFADFDNDGRMDVVVLNMNTPPTVLRNTSPQDEGDSWVKLSLRQPGGNREALGAIVEVSAPDGRTWRVPVIRQVSFLGCDDPRLHVGLGGAATCDVRVIWPGAERATTSFPGLAAGGHHLLDREGAEATRLPLPAFRGR